MSERDEVIARLERLSGDLPPSYTKSRATVQDAIRLLRAPAEGWQDIESAPKDRPVLVAWADKPTWAPVTAYPGDGQWTDEDGGIYRTPTHWMPLPAPPATEGDR